MRGFFVTGTDTGVGKTVVAAMLTLALPEATYWKPVQSGCEPSTDRADVAAWTGLSAHRLAPEVYRLALPASPHVSAAAEGISIERARLEAAAAALAGPVVAEGAGGVLVPLNDHETMLDLMQWLALPVVVVARTQLGTINHTLLTLEALRRRRLMVAALVLNGDSVPTTTRTLRQWGHPPCLLELAPLGAVTPASLGQAWAAMPEAPALLETI